MHKQSIPSLSLGGFEEQLSSWQLLSLRNLFCTGTSKSSTSLSTSAIKASLHINFRTLGSGMKVLDFSTQVCGHHFKHISWSLRQVMPWEGHLRAPGVGRLNLSRVLTSGDLSPAHRATESLTTPGPTARLSTPRPYNHPRGQPEAGAWHNTNAASYA